MCRGTQVGQMSRMLLKTSYSTQITHTPFKTKNRMSQVVSSTEVEKPLLVKIRVLWLPAKEKSLSNHFIRYLKIMTQGLYTCIPLHSLFPLLFLLFPISFCLQVQLFKIFFSTSRAQSSMHWVDPWDNLINMHLSDPLESGQPDTRQVPISWNPNI